MKRTKMFCYFCQKSKTNPFALAEGCTDFRPSTFQRQKDCKEHEDAINEEAMKDTFRSTQHCAFREQSRAILTAMRAVYWLAKEDIATVKYDSLLNFWMKLASKVLRIFEWEEMRNEVFKGIPR